MNKTAVLIHGLGRTKFSMNAMSRHLQKNGYLTALFGYRSRKLNLNKVVESLLSFLKSRQLLDNQLNFVGHSLGGIVSLKLAAMHNNLVSIERIVTLGSPLAGSVTASKLMQSRIIRLIMGPVLEELAERNLNFRLTENLEVGSIAGRVALKKGYYQTLDSENDGIVSVIETTTPGLKDHIIIPSSHTLLPSNKEAQRQTLNFLESGSFLHELV